MDDYCTKRNVAPVYLIIALISCAGYTMMLKTMHRCHLLAKPRYLIIVFLSISDCAFVLVFNISYIILTFVPAGNTCHVVTEAAVFICTVAFYFSCLLSVGMTINQYIAVAHGLRYPMIVTQKRIKCAAAACLLVCAVANGLFLIDERQVIILNTKMNRSRSLGNFLVVSVSGLVMLVNLVYSYHVSGQHIRRLSALELMSPYWKRRRQIRIEVTVITSVAISVLLPQSVLYLKSQIKQDSFDEDWLAITRGLLQLFCALNPYLYMFTLHQLRKRLKQNVKSLLPCLNWNERSNRRLSQASSIFTSSDRLTSENAHSSGFASQTQGMTLDGKIGIMTLKGDKYVMAERKELWLAGVINDLSAGTYKAIDPICAYVQECNFTSNSRV